MKHAELRAIVHNVADSLGSGMGLMIGCYEMDVYGEAQRSPTGAITVDLLEGTVIEGDPSASLAKAVSLYRDALANQCLKAGASIDDFVVAIARFWPGLLGGCFSVTVAGKDGRRSTTDYAGTPGQRLKIRDGLGRLRPKPSASAA
jgi:hypothetical protein